MRDGSCGLARQLEQMRADGVEPVMAGDAVVLVERVEKLESGGWAVHHGGSDGMVEQDHGVVGHPPEQIVEREDLRPVGVFGARCFIVDRRDGSLQCVTSDGSFLERVREQCDAFCDSGLVPQGAVLLVERDELAGGSGARGATGIGEEHKGEQTGYLGIVGQHCVSGAGETDGFGGEVGAREVGSGAGGIALVEDEIENVENGAEATRRALCWRAAESAPRKT